jgi:hypothetical protein
MNTSSCRGVSGRKKQVVPVQGVARWAKYRGRLAMTTSRVHTTRVPQPIRPRTRHRPGRRKSGRPEGAALEQGGRVWLIFFHRLSFRDGSASGSRRCAPAHPHPAHPHPAKRSALCQGGAPGAHRCSRRCASPQLDARAHLSLLVYRGAVCWSLRQPLRALVTSSSRKQAPRVKETTWRGEPPQRPCAGDQPGIRAGVQAGAPSSWTSAQSRGRVRRF